MESNQSNQSNQSNKRVHVMTPTFRWTGCDVQDMREHEEEPCGASIFHGAKRVKSTHTTDDTENVAPKQRAPHLEPPLNDMSDYCRLAQKADLMTVPHGASSGDRLAMLDVDNKILASVHFDVPANAYAGMVMEYTYPPAQFMLLLVDGTGYRVGGTVLHQHAVRLQNHRTHCCGDGCQVMGCHGDPLYELFEREAVSNDEIVRHKVAWKNARRSAFRARGVAVDANRRL